MLFWDDNGTFLVLPVHGAEPSGFKRPIPHGMMSYLGLEVIIPGACLDFMLLG